ncbi:VOC family protein [Streptomyces iranensis]|uniref:Catechol 2,3-dioxygenase-like lactoylglutathione lyase family enzyme n=1 Tax=Streptomyces iranensis TaxID=576784 RepID=A0A061A0Q0_9ACTN|nr:VOC family protein [Streptomyces iranensis]MBP2067850.1 catechol 2,3-dioxygenase-like lactoylglutathione lyase family enzyme [Streptomyces iranensis]CDR09303.1 Glyoxalase/bleomycin resistanceprotein/dioxygenase [Streptomyces iranensis]
MAIAKLIVTAVDCPDPTALAHFYQRVLGGEIKNEGKPWVDLHLPDGARLAFQEAPGFVAPSWPSAKESQQLHFDLRVTDMAAAQERVLALGARPLDLDDEGGKRDFRVFADPAGHPFCLIHP